MSQTRRTFLQHASAVALLARTGFPFAPQHEEHSETGLKDGQGRKSSPSANAAPAVTPMLHVLELPPFVDELPLPERLIPRHGKLRVTMREIHCQVHRDVPATRMWSYGETALGPVIEARSHEMLKVRWVNELPRRHFLPIDYSLHGCGRDLPEVRACVHLHGGRTPSKDDGQPEDWYVSGESRVCTYPLQQEATALWFHDHAMGLNRLNIYAGLVGMLLLRDQAEDQLELPSGKYELPLTLYDRDFTRDGQLFYPASADPARPWVSEFLADAILVNGKIKPFSNVEPPMYRLRMLNAANSRFFRIAVGAKTEVRKQSKLMTIQQVGSDQGLLPAPVPLEVFTFAPGERADVLVDFRKLAGEKIYLKNGPQELMEFRVGWDPASATKSLPAQLRAVPKPEPATAGLTRTITLNEYKDGVGNSMVMLLNRKHWHEPVTERPKLGSTEIWEFVNLTEDVHPMHLHLVRFRILDRRTFDTFEYLRNKQFRYLAAAREPEANEAGWKDVAQCPPGEVTRILVTFDGYAGRYLYHCHILEHEANDMMRPFEVVA